MPYSWSQNIYGVISGGYQFGVGKQNLEHHVVADFQDPYSPWPWKQVDVSLGKGAITNVILGYDFKQNYGISLTGSYLLGAEFSSITTKYDNVTFERKLSASMVRINPSFKLYVSENRLKTYADIGLIIGVGKVNFNYKGYREDTTLIEYNYIYDGGVSFGASARFGVDYELSKRIQVFAEFNFISQSYAPKKGSLTKYVVNNVDMTEFAQQDPSSSEIVFVEELQTDPTISPSLGEPEIRAKHSYAFHSYGLNVGVKFILWTNREEESKNH